MTSAVGPRAERASRRMLFLRDIYLRAHPNERLPIDPRKIADWAVDNGHWTPRDTPPKEVLRRKLSHAFRREYITDPQNREVRANYAVVQEVDTPDGPRRMSVFYPAYKAPPEVARQQFSLDRRQALTTIQQMVLDFESYNDNNEYGAKLPELDLNFERDIEEMRLPREYDPDPYGDDDEDAEESPY